MSIMWKVGHGSRMLALIRTAAEAFLVHAALWARAARHGPPRIAASTSCVPALVPACRGTTNHHQSLGGYHLFHFRTATAAGGWPKSLEVSRVTFPRFGNKHPPSAHIPRTRCSILIVFVFLPSDLLRWQLWLSKYFALLLISPFSGPEAMGSCGFQERVCLAARIVFSSAWRVL